MTLSPPARIRLFGLDLLDATRTEALDRLFDPTCRTAQFVNAHCINVAARDGAYRAALLRADLLLPDGSGLEIAARLHGARFTANLNGTDLFLPLARAAAERGLSLFLLGSAPGVAKAAAEAARRAAPGLAIAGVADGYFDDDEAMIARINAARPDVVLVGMGVPRQELWIDRRRDRIEAGLMMGVGAQFDFHAERVSRAPRVLRAAGLEWLWRLGVEPRRLFRRYVIGNPVFLVRTLRDRFRPR